MRTVLGATLVTTIPVLMRLWLGSYGYALPQTPKQPSFQPGVLLGPLAVRVAYRRTGRR